MAQTLLDQVVTSYPKRVDVWCQYVDMLVKEDLIDSARLVLIFYLVVVECKIRKYIKADGIIFLQHFIVHIIY